MTKRGRKLKAGPQQQHPKTSPTAHPLLASGHVRRRLPHVHVWPCQLLASSCSSKQAQALPPGWTVAYLIDTPKPIERASLAYAGQPGERDSPRLASSPSPSFRPSPTEEGTRPDRREREAAGLPLLGDWIGWAVSSTVGLRGPAPASGSDL